MFCPLSIDYGNVADWSGAVASFLAVVTALWIAMREANSLKKERLIAENTESGKMAAVRGEAMRIAAEIEAEAGRFIQLVNYGGGYFEGWTTVQHTISGLAAQLSALQRFPISNPRLYSEIGRIIYECDFERRDVRSLNLFKMALEDVEKAMRERREALVAIS